MRICDFSLDNKSQIFPRRGKPGGDPPPGSEIENRLCFINTFLDKIDRYIDFGGAPKKRYETTPDK